MAQTAQQEKTSRGVVETAKDVANRVGEAAQNAAQSASEMAGDAVSYIGRKADAASAAVGSGIKSMANTLESGGRYLQEHSLGDMASDVAGLIRRNPIPSLLIALGVGFLVARALRS